MRDWETDSISRNGREVTGINKLQVEHLTKIFPKKRKNDKEVTALSDINLEVAESEFVVIVGPSGCGKSTLINIIGGLETATEGTVLLDGHEVTDPGADPDGHAGASGKCQPQHEKHDSVYYP